jgi:hypothetical protein
MTIYLPKDVERSIEAAVHGGCFPSVDDALAEAWRAYLQHGRKRKQPFPGVASNGRTLPVFASCWTPCRPSPVTDVLTNRNHDEILYGL